MMCFYDRILVTKCLTIQLNVNSLASFLVMGKHITGSTLELGVFFE